MPRHKKRKPQRHGLQPTYASLRYPSSQELRVLLVWIYTCYRKLFRIVLREICTYFDSSSLILMPAVVEQKLVVFDVVSRKWKRCALRNQIKPVKDMKFAVIDERRVVCCGGTAASPGASKYCATVYLLYITGEVVMLACMSEPRSQCGLIYHRQALMVFGGVNKFGVRATCEEFDRVWLPLPNLLYARFPATHCLWMGEVYITGTPFYLGIEIYSPFERTFRLLDIRLGKSKSIMSYVEDGSLVLVQCKKYVRLDYNGRRVAGTWSLLKGPVTFGDQVVCWKRKIYSATSDAVISFDSRTFYPDCFYSY